MRSSSSHISTAIEHALYIIAPLYELYELLAEAPTTTFEVFKSNFVKHENSPILIPFCVRLTWVIKIMPGWLLRETNTFRTQYRELTLKRFYFKSENKCLETIKSDKEFVGRNDSF